MTWFTSRRPLSKAAVTPDKSPEDAASRNVRAHAKYVAVSALDECGVEEDKDDGDFEDAFDDEDGDESEEEEVVESIPVQF